MIISAWRGDCGLLYDANGIEIEGAIEANTETGLVTSVVFDDGVPRIVHVYGKPQVETETTIYSRPLSFMRKEVPRTG